MYSLAGFTVSTAEQVRTILLVAMLKRDEPLAKRAHELLRRLEG